jgi:hypothetical protein
MSVPRPKDTEELGESLLVRSLATVNPGDCRVSIDYTTKASRVPWVWYKNYINYHTAMSPNTQTFICSK